MNITTRRETGAAVFEVLDDRIDSSIAVEFKDYICQAIDSGQYEVVLDLSRVDFVDSSGIGAIVGVFKHLGTRGTFVVAGLSGAVARVFQLTRMEKVFQIFPSVEEALAAR